jgi:hypothetical protein
LSRLRFFSNPNNNNNTKSYVTLEMEGPGDQDFFAAAIEIVQQIKRNVEQFVSQQKQEIEAFKVSHAGSSTAEISNLNQQLTDSQVALTNALAANDTIRQEKEEAKASAQASIQELTERIAVLETQLSEANAAKEQAETKAGEARAAAQQASAAREEAEAAQRTLQAASAAGEKAKLAAAETQRQKLQELQRLADVVNLTIGKESAVLTASMSAERAPSETPSGTSSGTPSETPLTSSANESRQVKIDRLKAVKTNYEEAIKEQTRRKNPRFYVQDGTSYKYERDEKGKSKAADISLSRGKQLQAIAEALKNESAVSDADLDALIENVGTEGSDSKLVGQWELPFGGRRHASLGGISITEKDDFL